MTTQSLVDSLEIALVSRGVGAATAMVVGGGIIAGGVSIGLWQLRPWRGVGLRGPLDVGDLGARPPSPPEGDLARLPFPSPSAGDSGRVAAKSSCLRAAALLTKAALLDEEFRFRV